MMRAYRYAGATEQRKAALRRREDAIVLRVGARWRGAMYLLGYAIECSLKARLMERFGVVSLTELETRLAARMKRPVDLRTHSLDLLLEYTRSELRFNAAQRRSFGICRTWQVAWRYDPRNGSVEECDKFFVACDGFLDFLHRSV